MTANVQTQFGPGAADYAASAVHAAGESLGRLLALTRPQPDWRVLDVAAGAGHTALAFAPRAAQIVAADITPEMLAKTRQLAQARDIANLTTTFADAGMLPFGHGRFHLVICRLAAHHFPSLSRFLAEAVRVLRPGGLLAVTDTIAPGSRLRGKKAERVREAGQYINAFEKLRDPSHGRNLSLFEWEDRFRQAGFEITHQETLRMSLDFDDYAARMRVSPANRLRLRAMLLQAPPPVLAFLTPQTLGDRIRFQFTELILVGRLSVSSVQ